MIRCDAEFICPTTGGVSACEPTLESVDRERGRAVFAHQCGLGLEDVDIDELDEPPPWTLDEVLEEAAIRAAACGLWAEEEARAREEELWCPVWTPEIEPGMEG